MVVALGPGRFYGSALPRPRFYEDVKHASDGLRVDPPPPVLEPLLLWARDAHWSMGGTSFLRTRLQGRIEGSLHRLRIQKERSEGLSPKNPKKRPLEIAENEVLQFDSSTSSEEVEESPIAVDLPRRSGRNRRFVAHEEQEEAPVSVPGPVSVAKEVEAPPKKKRARKLGDEFDKVASLEPSIGKAKGKTNPSLPSVEKGRSKKVAPLPPRRSSRISPRKG